jgi:hypothetical protein
MSQYGPPGGPYPGQQPDRWADRQSSEPYREPSDPWGGNDPWGDTPTSGPEQPWRSGPDQPWQGGNDSTWQVGQPAGDPNWQASQPGDPTWQGYGQHTSAGDQNWHSPTQPGQGWAGAADQTWQQAGTAGHPTPTGHPTQAGQQHPSPAAPAWEPAAQPGRAGGKGGGVSGSLLAVVIGLAVLLCGGGAFGVYLISRGEDLPTGPDLTLPSATPETVPSTDPAAGADPTPEPTEADPTPTPSASNDARFVSVGQCVRNEAEGDATPELTIAACESGAYEVLARFDGVTDGEEDAKAKCADVTGYTNWYFFNSQLDALDFVLCLKQR